ncbi:hypothetical protein FQN51_000851 [Onygenales sp. PD_10]|nr:hypothetical protein FQN51_000851 [Onygenales sp. PD_10]
MAPVRMKPLSPSIFKLPTRPHFPFLRLPRELRDEVYKLAFAPISSNSLRPIGGRDTLPKSLAILHVCRQVNEEAGYVLYNQYIISFDDGGAMRSMFRSLSSSGVSRFRHICIGGTPIKSVLINRKPTHDFFAALWTFKRHSLPLSLKTFTVFDIAAYNVSFEIFLDLVKFGNCWKELRYFSPSAAKLGLSRADIGHAKPGYVSHKLEILNKIMLERDGQNSGASVTIYEATDPVYKQIWELCSTTVAGRNATATRRWKHEEALLVIARRGYHADISEGATPPYVFDRRTVGPQKYWLPPP